VVAQTPGMAVVEVSYCDILIAILTDIKRLARKQPRAGSSRRSTLDCLFSSSLCVFFRRFLLKEVTVHNSWNMMGDLGTTLATLVLDFVTGVLLFFLCAQIARNIEGNLGFGLNPGFIGCRFELRYGCISPVSPKNPFEAFFFSLWQNDLVSYLQCVFAFHNIFFLLRSIQDKDSDSMDI
jgi:hypothetical protein